MIINEINKDTYIYLDVKEIDRRSASSLGKPNYPVQTISSLEMVRWKSAFRNLNSEIALISRFAF